MISQVDLKAKQKVYRISDEEYGRILRLLGREPLAIEWALFSALWSEHCSYKSSRIHLKKFGKTLNQKVVTSQGENAGVLDLGFNERVVFKMESHNHPSFIEPYQGAATGVGGILRDIFTMGARPVMLADYLCFGEPTTPLMRHLVDGVARGISGYGNCVGVPTLTGQTNFDARYNQNILVNAMAVGLLLPGEELALSGAKGPGNLVVYVGAKTGRDGVHGAAMASESFDENSDAKKPNVQIGDPYFEKLLIESCLEVIQQKLVVAIQDMGAAGLTSSSFEMAAKGSVGMELDLSLVPLRDSEMGPEEILLSESQERMLLVCEPAKLGAIQAVFEKWGLDASVIGEVVANKKVTLLWRGEKLTEIDPQILVENAPLYERPFQTVPQNEGPQALLSKAQAGISDQQDPGQKMQLSKLLESWQNCSRKWIYSQYDQRVQARTVRGADHDVAIHRLPSGRGLAMTVGCRPSVMKLSARLGALDAVFYPSFQMALKGAEVQGITDCLNFGNPEKIEIMTEFVASVDAITEASLALDAPVISGNVSFYNETLGQNIISTPTTGLIGLVPDVENLPGDCIVGPASKLYLLTTRESLSVRDLARATKMLAQVVSGMGQGGLLSTQMVSWGGLLLSVAKMVQPEVGVEIEGAFSFESLTQDRFYQAIFEVSPEAEGSFLKSFVSTESETFWIIEKLGEVTTVSPEVKWKTHSWKVQDLILASSKGFGGFLDGIS